eukprot:TRINITY_DN344_c0_g1_i1.p1 TRINITY_DN344_c0_g1~~TRINITY_DN344_c0_g1_i1.p1  ORF type:complete len:1089 (-),score=103.22 TRINITY_DN344_c0_g1_i1:281-3547(-)
MSVRSLAFFICSSHTQSAAGHCTRLFLRSSPLFIQISPNSSGCDASRSRVRKAFRNAFEPVDADPIQNLMDKDFPAPPAPCVRYRSRIKDLRGLVRAEMKIAKEMIRWTSARLLSDVDNQYTLTIKTPEDVIDINGLHSGADTSSTVMRQIAEVLGCRANSLWMLSEPDFNTFMASATSPDAGDQKVARDPLKGCGRKPTGVVDVNSAKGLRKLDLTGPCLLQTANDAKFPVNWNNMESDNDAKHLTRVMVAAVFDAASFGRQIDALHDLKRDSLPALHASIAKHPALAARVSSQDPETPADTKKETASNNEPQADGAFAAIKDYNELRDVWADHVAIVSALRDHRPVPIRQPSESVKVFTQDIACPRALDLNEEQTKSVLQALVSPISLIHGPPGTGKTKTTGAVVWALLASAQIGGPRVRQVIACAPSNAAADAMAEKIAMVMSELDRKFNVQKFSVVRAGTGLHRTLQGVEWVQMSRRRCSDSEKKVAEATLRNANVIVSTTNTAAVVLGLVPTIDAVIIDEAPQATEPETLIPISTGLGGRGRVLRRVVLVGDPHQLPPMVLHENSKLTLSLFERLMCMSPTGVARKSGVPFVMLTEQFRMRSEICALPSKMSYRGRLVTSPRVAALDTSFVIPPHCDGLLPLPVIQGNTTDPPRWPILCSDWWNKCTRTGCAHLHKKDMLSLDQTANFKSGSDVFLRVALANAAASFVSRLAHEGSLILNVPTEDIRLSSSHSRTNVGQIHAAAQVAAALRMCGEQGIGVISMYSGAKNCILGALHSVGFQPPIAGQCPPGPVIEDRSPVDVQVVGSFRTLSQLQLRLGSMPNVNTVDAFQGSEMDHIIVLLIAKQPTSFLAKRRLNVALTRARKSVTIIGCTKKMPLNVSTKCMLEHHTLTNAVVDATLPPVAANNWPDTPNDVFASWNTEKLGPHLSSETFSTALEHTLRRVRLSSWTKHRATPPVFDVEMRREALAKSTDTRTVPSPRRARAGSATPPVSDVEVRREALAKSTDTRTVPSPRRARAGSATPPVSDVEVRREALAKSTDTRTVPPPRRARAVRGRREHSSSVKPHWPSGRASIFLRVRASM